MNKVKLLAQVESIPDSCPVCGTMLVSICGTDIGTHGAIHKVWGHYACKSNYAPGAPGDLKWSKCGNSDKVARELLSKMRQFKEIYEQETPK